jgi:hypothetical protein
VILVALSSPPAGSSRQEFGQGLIETDAASPMGYLAEDMETLPTAHAGS